MTISEEKYLRSFNRFKAPTPDQWPCVWESIEALIQQASQPVEQPASTAEVGTRCDNFFSNCDWSDHLAQVVFANDLEQETIALKAELANLHASHGKVQIEYAAMKQAIASAQADLVRMREALQAEADR